MSAPHRTISPNAVGRPSMIYDGRRLRKVLRDVQRGVPKRIAAERAGINPRTFDRWMTYGGQAERKIEEGYVLEPHEELFRAFRALVHRAIADFEARSVSASWDLALQTRKPSVILEILRRHPDTRQRWNVPTSIELVGDDDAGTGPADMSDEEIAARLETLERIAREHEEGSVTEA